MPISSVSQKGQITLPSSFRKRLGIKPRDRILIEADNTVIRIRPVPDLFKFKGFYKNPLPAEEERREMMKGVAAHCLGTRK